MKSRMVAASSQGGTDEDRELLVMGYKELCRLVE